jgi:hypothetical protein
LLIYGGVSNCPYMCAWVILSGAARIILSELCWATEPWAQKLAPKFPPAELSSIDTLARARLAKEERTSCWGTKNSLLFLSELPRQKKKSVWTLLHLQTLCPVLISFVSCGAALLTFFLHCRLASNFFQYSCSSVRSFLEAVDYWEIMMAIDLQYISLQTDNNDHCFLNPKENKEEA